MTAAEPCPWCLNPPGGKHPPYCDRCWSAYQHFLAESAEADQPTLADVLVLVGLIALAAAGVIAVVLGVLWPLFCAVALVLLAAGLAPAPTSKRPDSIVRAIQVDRKNQEAD